MYTRVHPWCPKAVNSPDKFAHIAALRPARRREPPPERVNETPTEAIALGGRLADLLGARVRRNHYGEHLSIGQWYATPEVCSLDARSLSLLLPQTEDTADLLATAMNPEQWLFLDTETTGLAGGTGTYAFLVGIAWWDAGGLRVEQFFMRDLNEEHSLLLELAERMAERRALVTFNGKSFDWPLLETRYRMTRAIRPPTPKVHLDLLHPARRIWRMRLGSVRLKDLERHVLGSDGRTLDWSRERDIDSSLIPQFYFDFLRGGPAEPLAGVIRHNQMDLRGLAALAGTLFALLDTGNGIADSQPPDARDPIEVLGLSRLLRSRGRSGRARELYEAALRGGLPRQAQSLAQSELALLAKRDADYSRATSLWDELRTFPKAPKSKLASLTLEEDRKNLITSIQAAEQLAIHYERREKSPAAAAELVRAAIANLRDAQKSRRIESSRAAKLETRLAHRLQRLERRASPRKPPKLFAAGSSS